MQLSILFEAFDSAAYEAQQQIMKPFWKLEHDVSELIIMMSDFDHYVENGFIPRRVQRILNVIQDMALDTQEKETLQAKLTSSIKTMVLDGIKLIAQLYLKYGKTTLEPIDDQFPLNHPLQPDVKYKDVPSYVNIL